MTRTVRVDIPNPLQIYNEAYLPYFTNQKRLQIFFGGAASGKSVFLAQRTVRNVLKGRNYLVVRNVAGTLRGSCWNEIVKVINVMGLEEQFHIGKSDMTITCVPSMAQIIFIGLDDVQKIKSITPANGVITDIWIEEATEVTYDDYKQLTKRLRGISHLKDKTKRVTLSFNPVYKTHWIYGEFFKNWDDLKSTYEDDNLLIVRTTYKDNRFLTEDDIASLENEANKYFRDVYTLGVWGTLGDLVFSEWSVEDLSEIARTADHVFYGLDFGFSSDPCALVKVHYDKKHRTIYILDEIYEKHLVNQQLADIIRPIVGNHYVTCDSSEPKSIAELRGYGINAVPAKKGQDSVTHGIQWLQSHRIVVDTHCQNMKNELSIYQWRKDKDGNSMRVPEDRNNHLIDAWRYSLETESTARYASTFSREGLGF